METSAQQASAGPYEPPKAVVADPASVPLDQVRRVAKYQRLLILAVVIGAFGPLIPLVGIVVLILNIGFQVWCVVKLSAALELNRAAKWIFVVLMFVPLVSLIALLVLNAKATRFIRNAGYRVGLIGAKIPQAS
jgi:hypothetical protein